MIDTGAQSTLFRLMQSQQISIPKINKKILPKISSEWRIPLWRVVSCFSKQDE